MNPGTLILAAALVLPATAHPVGNINRYLSNSARTDLVGQDMWTTLKEFSDDRVSKPDQVASGLPQVPEENWGRPKLGMQGGLLRGSEYPITTVAKNNPMYWTGNAIAGPTASSIEKPHGYPCCWNGPMWNYNNSAMCEALGSV